MAVPYQWIVPENIPDIYTRTAYSLIGRLLTRIPWPVKV